MAPAKTNRCKAAPTALFLTAVLAMTTGCQLRSTPPCPGFGSEQRASSAGCLAIKDGKLLVVQDFNGRISPPGGNARDGESAQCTAFRETWEETGLQLAPGRLLEVFDTGFHLYHCEHHPASGDIDPPPRLEVSDVFYLASTAFGDYEWRYPEQQAVMERLLQREIKR
jgi:8-oxo-dGTP pyrophosphatase MutT (NUDIX family)